MALLPSLLDEIRPRRFGDQLFGMGIASGGFLTDIIEPPSVPIRRYLRPWKNLSTVQRDFGSTIKSDKDKFQVNLDVHHFSPEEISVKTADRYVIVEGKHEESKDEHGFVSRQFKRKYLLPKECNGETVESKLSKDGILTVTAPKLSNPKDERAVPITHTGPVRRKAADDGPGQAVDKEISSQKKRRY